MRKIISGCIAVMLAMSMASGTYALEVPISTAIRNLDGVQEYIKVYTLSPEADAEQLIEPPFEYNGYSYTYLDMVKSENILSDTRLQTETVTVETEKKDLDTVLAALESTIEYDDGSYRGTLSLDHTTIQTEASGYKSSSYAVTDVKEIGGLSGNDMSFVPATTVKNGITLQLSNVDWQIQSTDLVDDVLVPASYVAVATYTGTAWYKTATGYVTTADYTGEVTSSGLDSITYTLTYTGTPIAVEEPEPQTDSAPPDEEPPPAEETVPAEVSLSPETDGTKSIMEDSPKPVSIPALAWIVGGALVLVIIALAVLLILSVKRKNTRRTGYYEMEDNDYEDQN